MSIAENQLVENGLVFRVELRHYIAPSTQA